MSHVLIVDDEPGICWSFREFLTEDGHDVSVAASAEEAFRIVDQRRPDAVVLDVRLPGMDGLSALRRLKAQTGGAPIIVITAFGNLETAVRAVREGAFDYLSKPFDLDQAADLVGRALAAAEDRPPPRPALDPAELAGTLVGSSRPMQAVFKQIALVAPTDVPVLITGESGTGKELVARAIHEHSARSDQPFVPVCLGALGAGVVESELFGHVRGSFTGAVRDRAGLLELAGGGTVLLDEIGDTTPELQVKLLRAIEQRELTPVGDARPRKIQARILAATNRALPELIRSGHFREDLYFRLSVFEIRLPNLRDRRDDLPELAAHFLGRCAVRPGGGPLADDVLEELRRRPWPGNVRELRNVIEHAAVVARGQPIRPEHLPPPAPVLRAARSSDEDLAARIDDWARRPSAEADPAGSTGVYERFLALTEPPLLKAVLAACDGNRAAAATRLGIHRTTLRQKLRKYGLD
ncbi:MAG TPA: sigma-54 dependent transcriptional regulator [Planctomycetaceae bacterium]|nr:sigma-54 dependent transcriptional regulator [Planctomycetaceae bacterium]